MSSQAQVLAFISAMQHMRLATYFDLASFIILIYDYLLTLRQERDLLWRSGWPIAKFMFFITRYGPFVDMPVVLWHQWAPGLSIEQCGFAYRFTGWLFFLGILGTELVLMWRTWAVWDQNLSIGTGLAVWSLLILIPDFVVEAKFLKGISFSLIPEPWTGCLLTGGDSKLLSINWILLVVLEAGVLVLVLIKAFQKYKFHGRTPLYKAVYRDGSLFYICLFALSVANVIVIFTAPPDLIALLASLERVMHSVLASRLLLRMRSVGGKATHPVVYSSSFDVELVDILPDIQNR